MNKKILLITIVTLIILMFVLFFSYYFGKKITTVNTEKEGVLIGFSLSTLQEQRWQRDRDEFVKTATSLGAIVDVQSAENDVSTQIYQIESMISKGANAIVVVPYDASSLKVVLEKARSKGIKIISYDRLIKDTDIDLYVSFDSEKVGEYQAEYVLKALKDKFTPNNKLKVAYIGGSQTDNNAILLKSGSFKILQPEIDSGKIEVVLNKFTPDWSPNTAYKNIKEYLMKSKGNIDAVIVANDGMAFGVINALAEYRLSGIVPVSGQDAELSAIQRIIDGTQVVTVYKPIQVLASKTAELVVALARNEAVVTSNVVINNGKMNVPAVLLESVAVTKENIDDTVIKDGFYTRDEVYKKK